MARIRTIKPSIWGDDRFAGLSRDARLLAIGLISSADDDGRFIASANAIAGYVYPHDEIPPATIRRWRTEIADTGMIVLYQVDGREYGHFPRWKRHQRINRPNPSVFPPPDPTGGCTEPGAPDSVSHSVNGSVSDPVSEARVAHGGTRESLSGGREGKGRDKRTTQVRAPVAYVDADARDHENGADRGHSPAGELAAHYAAGVPLTDHARAMRTIAEALATGTPADLIRAGLNRLITEQRGCTPDQLRIAILGSDAWRPAAKPSTTDRRVQDHLDLAAELRAEEATALTQTPLRAITGGAA